jgi:hypothetical protein
VSTREQTAWITGQVLGLLSLLTVEGAAVLLAEPGFKYGAQVRALLDAKARILGGGTALDETTRRAIRAIFAAVDMKLAAELQILHKGTALAVGMMMRDTVRSLDPQLAEELTFEKAEEAAKK